VSRRDDGEAGHDPDTPPDAEDPLAALGDRDLSRAAHRLTARITLIGALVLHLMVGALLPTTPQLAPAWALPVFATLWFVIAALVLRWYRIRAITTLLLPMALVVVWLATLWAGSNLFGWGG